MGCWCWVSSRSGWLLELLTELITEGDEAKANLCQKLVCSMLKNLKAYFSSQSGYFLNYFLLQVLTYKLSAKSVEAKIWTEKLKSHLESTGLSKQEKVKISLFSYSPIETRSLSGKDSSEVELKGLCEEETTAKQRQVLISTNTRGGEK